ncbi:hypothetical protein [Phytomonospora endophytica]|uniref:DUF1963 domain-containing protein n=1 Tax=Phytomonospora endophytica TaxID=714109 RepID=A0A841FUV3_9ACTN|nr:hypothetical protein [Phytomonospora endophytica]MBB6035760.1 hypothetical protein [Phytomonospora endophytica]GIG69561.1 hypothetical protein Pen01_58560 [Phytomonospora endophytica]
MVTLLTYAGDVPADAPVLRTGGLPLVPGGFAWPDCSECDGPMMFHAHLPVDEGVVSVFMCQNEPGLCEEWDPAAGGNRAYLFPRDAPLRAANPPEEGETLLTVVNGLRPTEVPQPEYPDALEAWTEGGNDRRDALGQLAGTPFWLQGDEHPDCPGCARPMDFAAMLEPGRDYQSGMNFGGDGWGYVFTCAACVRASFLWQC